MPTIDDLLLLDGQQIKAIKVAISHHKNENPNSFSRNHPNLEEILKFKFRNGLSELLANFDRWLPNKPSDKSVKFDLDGHKDGSIKIKCINLTLEEIDLSSYFRVSLQEMGLFKFQ